MKRYYSWCRTCGCVTEHHKEFPNLMGRTSYFCLTCQPFVRHVGIIEFSSSTISVMEMIRKHSQAVTAGKKEA